MMQLASHNSRFSANFSINRLLRALALMCCVMALSLSAEARLVDQSLSQRPDPQFTSFVQSLQGQAVEAFGYEVRVLFDGRSAAPEIAPLLGAFRLIAGNQTDFWGDSILEQSFDADDVTSVDRIEGVYESGRLVAYRIEYSQRAWRLAESGERHEEGRIVERSYVSGSLGTWARDLNALATFR